MQRYATSTLARCKVYDDLGLTLQFQMHTLGRNANRTRNQTMRMKHMSTAEQPRTNTRRSTREWINREAHPGPRPAPAAARNESSG